MMLQIYVIFLRKTNILFCLNRLGIMLLQALEHVVCLRKIGQGLAKRICKLLEVLYGMLLLRKKND